MNQSHSAAIRSGIATAKANGVVFGRSGKDLAARNKAAAFAHAENLRSLFLACLRHNIRTTERLAFHFNRMGVPTARGGRWSRSTITRLMQCLDLSVETAIDTKAEEVPDPHGRSWPEWLTIFEQPEH